MSEHTITLRLIEADDNLLRRELGKARTAAQVCEQQGQHLHTWTTRANAIQAEIDRRLSAPKAGKRTRGGVVSPTDREQGEAVTDQQVERPELQIIRDALRRCDDAIDHDGDPSVDVVMDSVEKAHAACLSLEARLREVERELEQAQNPQHVVNLDMQEEWAAALASANRVIEAEAEARRRSECRTESAEKSRELLREALKWGIANLSFTGHRKKDALLAEFRDAARRALTEAAAEEGE